MDFFESFKKELKTYPYSYDLSYVHITVLLLRSMYYVPFVFNIMITELCSVSSHDWNL